MRELVANCARCAGLCCVAPAFAKSSDFAIDKPAGKPCPNLRDDFRCKIHEQLEARGFRGCAVFDCFGAGQHLTQETFGGRDWQSSPEIAGAMFAALPVMRQLHEMLWYLTEALGLDAAKRLHPKLTAARDKTEELSRGTPEQLATIDLDAHRMRVNPLLQKASELARAGTGRRPDHRGANLIGRRMRGADLRGASFRGALLIGADLRDADLRGADLTGALFLTQAQLDAAKGDAATALPPALSRPAHW